MVAAVVFLLLLALLRTTHELAPTNTLTIHHAGAGTMSKSWEEMVAGDAARLLYLTSLAAGGGRTTVPIASGRQTPLHTANYVVRAAVGTPPQPLLMAMDTSNDAAWVPSAVFSIAASPTFKTLPCGAPQCRQVPNPICSGRPAAMACSYNLTYGGASFAANLAQDTLTLSGDSFPSYTFACLLRSAAADTAAPPQGLLGLGRGPLSLVSQTGAYYHSTFSYCLPSAMSANFSGSLRLGVAGQPVRIKTTPLLRNPRRPSLYYVNLVAIRVGRHAVAGVPPSALAFDPATGAGTVVDSGTTFTRLVAPAYERVRDELRRRVGLPATALGGFDTCFEGPVAAPTVTFEFEAANVTLPPENMWINSSATSLVCLAMAASPGNVNSVVNVVASWQLQNHRVLIDVPNKRVGFAREPCSISRIS